MAITIEKMRQCNDHKQTHATHMQLLCNRLPTLKLVTIYFKIKVRFYSTIYLH